MAEPQPQQRSLGERINTWVQTTGILVAAGWGFYTFVYKEIEVPKSAPVNISLTLELKKIDTGVITEQLTAIELKVSVTNPSSRKIYLLPTAWIAYGENFTAIKTDEETFIKYANAQLLDTKNISTLQRYAQSQDILSKTLFRPIATGHLFHYDSLKPGETTTRQLLFFVPKGDYNAVSLSTIMPTAEDISGMQLEWSIRMTPPSNIYSLQPALYHLDNTGKRTLVQPDAEGKYPGRSDVQQAEAHAEITL